MRRDDGEITVIVLSMIGASATAFGVAAVAAASRLDATQAWVAIVGGIVAIVLSLGAAAGAVLKAINARTRAKAEQAAAFRELTEKVSELTSDITVAKTVAYGAQELARAAARELGIPTGPVGP